MKVFLENYKVQTSTNSLFIKLDKVLKFTLKSLRLAPTLESVYSH